jgi:signal transduction histidine kinase
MRVDLPGHPILVGVSATDLSAGLDALLGNVFAYTPEAAPFTVSLRTMPAGARLVVTDAGPGFADGDAVLRRGTSGAGSTGLGLDIARRMAESSGGTLHLGTGANGGAEVTVVLGPPA